MTENALPTGDAAANHSGKLFLRAVGGSTVVLELGGLRLITDPTFDEPGDYRSPVGVISKTAPPALGPDEVGPVDAVLLSHDQHPDNLDKAGREYLKAVPLVLTTPASADRVGGNAQGLAPWEHHDLQRPGGTSLRITAVPAQHGPEGAEAVSGPVTGFVLTAADLPTVYVSGDNASVDVVRDITERCSPIDTVILFAGAARPGTFDGGLVTFDSEGAAAAAEVLQARHVVPAHWNSWSHVADGADSLRAAFNRAGLADRLELLQPGESATL